MIKKTTLIALLIFLPTTNFAASNGNFNLTPKTQKLEEKPPEVVFLSNSKLKKHQKSIEKIQDYLSGLTTITSEFTQIAPNGGLASGKFFLKRPGKMRWQYNPPTPILMVGNGSDLVYYDYELEQITHIPMDSTLIGFLAQKKIRFDDSVGIISFEENPGSIRIGVAQTGKPEEGQLVLEFSNKPLLIRNMVVTDTNGKVTNVSLNNAKFGVKIDEKLFDFRDPRKRRLR